MRRARRDFRLGKCIDGINGQGRCSRTDAFARIPRKEGVESDECFAGILAGYKHLIKIGSFMGLLHEPDFKLSSSAGQGAWTGYCNGIGPRLRNSQAEPYEAIKSAVA